MATPIEKCEEMIAKLQREIASFSEKSALLDKLQREIASFDEKLDNRIAQTSTKDEINALTQKLDTILTVLQESHESEGDRYFQAREYKKAIFEYEKAVKLGKTSVQTKIEEAEKKAQECIYLQLNYVQLELVEIV